MKHTLNIKLYLSELIYDVQQRAYLIGESMRTDQNAEQAAMVQELTDERKDAILRSFGTTWDTLRSVLHKYIATTENAVDNVLLPETVSTKTTKLPFTFGLETLTTSENTDDEASAQSLVNTALSSSTSIGTLGGNTGIDTSGGTIGTITPTISTTTWADSSYAGAGTTYGSSPYFSKDKGKFYITAGALSNQKNYTSWAGFSDIEDSSKYIATDGTFFYYDGTYYYTYDGTTLAKISTAELESIGNETKANTLTVTVVLPTNFSPAAADALASNAHAAMSAAALAEWLLLTPARELASTYVAESQAALNTMRSALSCRQAPTRTVPAEWNRNQTSFE